MHSYDVRFWFFPHLLYYFLHLASVRLCCGLLPLNRPVAIRISHKYLLLGFSNFFTKAINSSMFPSFSFAPFFFLVSSFWCWFFSLVHVQCVFYFKSSLRFSIFHLRLLVFMHFLLYFGAIWKTHTFSNMRVPYVFSNRTHRESSTAKAAATAATATAISTKSRIVLNISLFWSHSLRLVQSTEQATFAQGVTIATVLLSSVFHVSHILLTHWLRS